MVMLRLASRRSLHPLRHQCPQTTTAPAALPIFTSGRNFSSAPSVDDTVNVDIPVPSGNWPLVGHLPRLIKGGDSVINWKSMHDECGDIYQVFLPGNKNLVVTSSPAHTREILSQQGKQVFRTSIPAWTQIFKDNKWPEAIPVARGDDWLRRRRILAGNLLTLKSAKAYIPKVLPAANNFIHCLQGHLTEDGRIVDRAFLRELAGMFSLEAVMKVVVGVDFPCQTIPLHPDAAGFAKAMEAQFRLTGVVNGGPWHTKFRMKPYRDLERAWQEIHRYPSETLEPILEYYEKHGKLPEEVHGTVFFKLMEAYEAGDLSLEEVKGIGVQAIAAALDTTAQTIEYLFYNLANNPDVQAQIVEEMDATLGTRQGPLDMTIPQYEEQKYLFATLKESMRYTPTIGSHARTMTRDFNVGGHYLPEGQVVLMNYLAMTRDPEIYPDPELFLPERFLKGKDAKPMASSNAPVGCPFTAAKKAEAIEKGNAVCRDKYAAVSFGHGGRKCPGAGFAQMDIHLLTMAVLRKYKVTYDGPPLVQTEKQLLRSKEDISPYFKFVPRA